MEQLLERVNKIGSKPAWPPTKKLSEMTVGDTFFVKKIERVQTKLYGIKLVATMENFSCFLPARMEKMTDEDICELNLVPNLNMVFLGKDEFNSHKIQFKSSSCPSAQDYYQSFYNSLN